MPRPRKAVALPVEPVIEPVEETPKAYLPTAREELEALYAEMKRLGIDRIGQVEARLAR